MTELKAQIVRDPFDLLPLLSQSIWLYSDPNEWSDYVKSLYDPTSGKKGKKKAAPTKPCVVTKNKKGSVVFRIKRSPKWITEKELHQFAGELGLEPSELKRLAGTRKIEVRKDKADGDSKL